MMRNRKRIVTGGIGVVALAAIVGSVSVASAGSAAGPSRDHWGRTEAAAAALPLAPGDDEGNVTIVVNSPFSNDFVEIDEKPLGESVGDSIQFRQDVIDPNTSATVGQIQVQCTFAFNFEALCAGTLNLFGRGQINFYGIPGGDDPFQIGVTGGTHEFREAAGTFGVRIFGAYEEYTIRLFS